MSRDTTAETERPTDARNRAMIVQRSDSGPSTSMRLIAIVVCPVYLLVVAVAFSAATETPLAATLPVVVISAAAIIAVLIAFGVKAYRRTDRRLRFNLGTVLLLMVPVCIYLTALQQLVQTVPPQDREPALLLMIFIFGLFLAGFTTGILLYFAEAVMWLALGILRWRTRSGQSR